MSKTNVESECGGRNPSTEKRRRENIFDVFVVGVVNGAKSFQESRNVVSTKKKS